MRGTAWAAAALLAVLVGAVAAWDDMPEDWRRPKDLPRAPLTPGEGPPAEEYMLEDGLRLELVVTELTYPTALAFGPEGRLFVLESGYSLGPSTAIPRVLEVTNGTWQEVARLPDGPLTGLVHHDGLLYVVGGRDPGRLWSVDPDDGEVRHVLGGFPVWGRHFTSGLAVGPEGRLYFAVGDPTNSGILGLEDYLTYGFLSVFPEARGIPCEEQRVQAVNVAMKNPFDADPDARVTTGPYHRFAEPAREGATVGGAAPGCNGALFRVWPDGSDLEVVATGLRHVRGLAFDAEGRLLATEDGMLPHGSRPVDGPCDALWHIRSGGWYGFPDHSCGVHVSDPALRPQGREAPTPLLIDPPPLAEGPLHAFARGTTPAGLSLAPPGTAHEGQLLVAMYGSHFVYPPEGMRLLRLDLAGGEGHVVYQNLAPGMNGTAPDRPIAVAHGPDGDLFLVDFGALTTTTKTFHPAALTGGIWRITAASATADLLLFLAAPRGLRPWVPGTRSKGRAGGEGRPHVPPTAGHDLPRTAHRARTAHRPCTAHRARTARAAASMRLRAVLLLACLLAPVAAAQDEGPPPDQVRPPHEMPRPVVGVGEAPEPGDYELDPGYDLRLVSPEMTFPTAIAISDAGDVYVVEAGYSYGSAAAIPRILRVHDNGSTEEVVRLPDGPVTGLVHHDAALFAIGGRDPAEVWRIDPESGDLQTILTGFPVWGHHFTSQLVVGPEDDRLYFVVGMPSNSGVIGLEDFYEFQYLSIFPEARDIPCHRVVLAGHDFNTTNPFTEDPDDTVETGAFHRFGEPSYPGEVIEATPAPGCNGAVFSARTDGSDLEVYATGFRNPFGINFDPQGRLFLIDQGMDNGGSRPIANDPEPMWQVRPGGWHGFPDYPSGFPVTLPGFHGEQKPRPEPLLLEHPPLAGRPFFLLVPSCGCMQFDFSPGGAFGHEGHAFIAEYGAQFHKDRPGGFRVERLDMQTKTIGDFYVNLRPGPNGTAPERPISVAFGPDDSMYLLDFGGLSTDSLIFFSSPLTGGLWRISPAGADTHGTDERQMPAAMPLTVLAALLMAGWSGRRRDHA